MYAVNDLHNISYITYVACYYYFNYSYCNVCCYFMSKLGVLIILNLVSRDISRLNRANNIIINGAINQPFPLISHILSQPAVFWTIPSLGWFNWYWFESASVW